MDNDIFSGDTLKAFTEGVIRARKEALAAGLPVLSLDEQGRYIQEWPDGRLFEVKLRSGAPRESPVEVIRELSRTAA